jgi:hypothetical protein
MADLYVAPVDGVAQWWVATDHDGATFMGWFEGASRMFPPEDLREDGYQLGFEASAAPLTWRPATREEAVAVVWEQGVSGS